MHQDDEFSRDGDRCSAFGVLPTPLREVESPPAEIAVLPEWAENVVGAPHGQFSKEGVAGLGDPQLLVAIARLIPSRIEPDECPHHSALLESVFVLQCQ